MVPATSAPTHSELHQVAAIPEPTSLRSRVVALQRRFARAGDGENHGGGTVTVRLHGNDDDKAHKLNRTENLRPIASTDPDFDRLYPRRNDAESINRDLDDTLYLRRAHTLGHARQHLNLLGYALLINAVTLRCYGDRREPDALAAHTGESGAPEVAKKHPRPIPRPPEPADLRNYA